MPLTVERCTHDASDASAGVLCSQLYILWFSATHIPEQLNSQMDTISRNSVDQFPAEVPLASPSPATISPIPQYCNYI